MNLAEYCHYDGLGLAELVRRRQVTAAELVEAAIERLERHNPTLNAVVYKAYDLARRMAATQPRPGTGGPLQGVPMLLKDISGDCEGMPSTVGCRGLQDASPSDHDSVQVARFKAAGLIPLGKTNTPEWGLLPTTEPLFYGPTNNPWDTQRSPGGSSGGAAAAVAAGIVPIAHANDGGGSIRMPASACGLVGLKPTRGRISWGPTLGEAIDGFVCEHVVTRTVRDCAAVLDATAGPSPGDPYWAEPPQRPYLNELAARPSRLRIAYWTEGLMGNAVHADCQHAVRAAAQLCADLGHEVAEATPKPDLSALLGAWKTTYFANCQLLVDVGSALLFGKSLTRDDVEPLTWATAERARTFSALDYQVAAFVRQQEARDIGRFHEHYDVWLTPTLAEPPVRTGTLSGAMTDVDADWGKIAAYMSSCCVANATGQPSMSLPLHWNAQGLPIGAMFTAACGNESVLFQLAAQLEEAQPWIQRKPPVWG
jgi:amidase